MSFEELQATLNRIRVLRRAMAQDCRQWHIREYSTLLNRLDGEFGVVYTTRLLMAIR